MGDFVPDFRLLDYFVAPLSTHECPVLDGSAGNQDRLKRDLAQQGIYDPRMAFYSMYRLREFARMGYSGFEGRIFSLFDRLGEDLRQAADVQNLVTALAFQYVLEGRVTHGDIPDDPSTESERRQIFFGTAIGIPTFFVHARTANRFLARIVGQTPKTRLSHRYTDYRRVYNLEYRRTLLEILKRDAAGLVEMLGLGETLADLRQRIEDPARCSAAGRLTSAILEELNVRSPLSVPAAEFNRAAERATIGRPSAGSTSARHLTSWTRTCGPRDSSAAGNALRWKCKRPGATGRTSCTKPEPPCWRTARGRGICEVSFI